MKQPEKKYPPEEQSGNRDSRRQMPSFRYLANAAAGEPMWGIPQAPQLYLVLKPDLTIVKASDEYLRATLLWREEVRGASFFDIFPDNPNDPAATGVKNLYASLERVIQHGMPHRMAVQQYDVRDYVSGDRAWIEKYWAPVNFPVFNEGSSEVAYVVHQVEDVTRAVLARRWAAEQAQVVAEQRATLAQMQQDMQDREEELLVAQQRLEAALGAPEPQDTSVETIIREFGITESRRYFHAGEHVPVAGFYEAFHHLSCTRALHRVFLQPGGSFPRCYRCGNGVFYRLRLHH